MRVLFIGGTGNISRSCAELAVSKGWEVLLYHRGSHPDLVPPGAQAIIGDIRDPEASARVLRGRRFDCVAQFVAYVPEHIENDIQLFDKNAAQYIFISSASAYHKPILTPVITESTPLHNPFWRYSREKIACERRLMQAYEQTGFPATIVRPSHTYGDGWIPTTFGSRDFTVAQRILDGKEIVVHGDGTSLWTLTHASDFAKGFVGLMGNPRAVGEAFHITSDESLSWDQIHRTLAAALGREPTIVHVPSDAIAVLSPTRGAGLLGDKAHSVIFDNSKIKRFVPGFQCTVPYHEGIRRSLQWLESHPANKEISLEADAEIEALLRIWESAVPCPAPSA